MDDHERKIIQHYLKNYADPQLAVVRMLLPPCFQGTLKQTTWKKSIERILKRIGKSKCYLTFDIDCLDPAYAPGTGTPVVGGMSTDKVLKILRGVKDLNIVGFDLVEVAPAYDHADITSLAGASIVLEFLYILGHQKQR